MFDDARKNEFINEGRRRRKDDFKNQTDEKSWLTCLYTIVNCEEDVIIPSPYITYLHKRWEK